MRTQSEKYFQTNQIIASNEKILNLVYPVGMMDALKSIVSDQRSSDSFYQSLKNARNEEVAIIWGQVMVDDKPVAKAEVSLEGQDELQPIYFNTFHIPDPQLKETSENGLFAFIGSKEGLQSLVARRGFKYIAHSNVYVEQGAVAYSDMKTTTKIQPVVLKSFDAFTGAPVPAKVQMQSIDFTVDIVDGMNLIHLPIMNRLGFAQAEVPQGYVPGVYAYNDKEDHLHFPLVTYQWMNEIAYEIQSRHGVSVNGQRGTTVGFVSDEEFVVQTWGSDRPQDTLIVYFDAQGKLLNQNTGVAGGGFIIVNYDGPDQQLSVDFLQSQTTSLRVLPLNPNSVTLLNVSPNL